MLIGENILLALTALKANKMRSLLTMLGIIIGIASVIAIMTLGDSISSSVTDSMSSIGANNITVGLQQKSTSTETTGSGMTFSFGPRMTQMQEEDYVTDEMLGDLAERYSDYIDGFSLSESIGSGTARKGSLTANVNVEGVNSANLEKADLTLLAGRTLTERDQEEGRKVALVSDLLAKNMFDGDNMNAVGKTVDILFNNRYYKNNKSFEIGAMSMESIVKSMTEMLGTISMAIAAIAGISLLVGGIGVMNIMMVSVTERTREIGTRKALGATNGSIRLQFIMEAIVLCLLGGVIGILLGIGIASVATNMMGYAVSPSYAGIFCSVSFSVFIGVFFGYYPANKAAKLNPIDALRHE